MTELFDWKFGARSKQELQGVHPDLIICVAQALPICSVDFGVHDGLRTKETQRELVDRGVSWTMNSMHLVQNETGWGHAVDLVPYIAGRLSWDSIEAFIEIGNCMKEVAARNSIALTWGANVQYGGHWQRINDMAHFQLRKSVYLR